MDFKAQLDELEEQGRKLIGKARIYFAGLNQQEQYGWYAEGGGALLVLTGIILLIF